MDENKKIEKIAVLLAESLKLHIRMICNPALEYLDNGYQPFRKEVIKLMEKRRLNNNALKYLIKIVLINAGVNEAPVKLSYIPPNYREQLLALMHITVVQNEKA